MSSSCPWFASVLLPSDVLSCFVFFWVRRPPFVRYFLLAQYPSILSSSLLAFSSCAAPTTGGVCTPRCTPGTEYADTKYTIHAGGGVQVVRGETEAVFTIRDDNPIHFFPFDRQELTVVLTMPKSINGRDKHRYFVPYRVALVSEHDLPGWYVHLLCCTYRLLFFFWQRNCYYTMCWYQHSLFLSSRCIVLSL